MIILSLETGHVPFDGTYFHTYDHSILHSYCVMALGGCNRFRLFSLPRVFCYCPSIATIVNLWAIYCTTRQRNKNSKIKQQLLYILRWVLGVKGTREQKGFNCLMKKQGGRELHISQEHGRHYRELPWTYPFGGWTISRIFYLEQLDGQSWMWQKMIVPDAML